MSKLVFDGFDFGDTRLDYYLCNLHIGPLGGGGILGGEGFTIEQSALFDGGHLTRTPSSVGDRRTWTFILWVKRSEILSSNTLFSADIGAAEDVIRYDGNNKLAAFPNSLNAYGYKTQAVYRDIDGYTQVAVVSDTPQATALDRLKIYQDGVDITAFLDISPAVIAQNYQWGFNNTVIHYIGVKANGLADPYKGYLSDIHFIDGQALTPTDFGAFDSEGYWNPIIYTGSYGTNGFHLDFADAGDLGNDVSGNNNDWTKNGTITQVSDSPTDSVTKGIGNQCVWNAVTNSANTSLSDGNKRVDDTSTATIDQVLGTLGATAGKFYWEFEVTASSPYPGVGAGDLAKLPGVDQSVGITTVYGSPDAWSYQPDGNVRNAGVSAYGDTWTTGDTIGVALDMDNGNLFFSKDGTWQNSATTNEIEAGTGTNAAATGLAGRFGPVWLGGNAAVDTVLVMDSADWTYAAPTGFKSLSTQNLPAVADGDLSKHWATVLYTGNGVAIGSGGNAIAGVGFPPDFAWLKGRTFTGTHHWYDTIRGATKKIGSDTAAAETTFAEALESFDADGFTVGNEGSVNNSGSTYVAWCASLPNTVTSGWAGSPTITPSKEIYNATLGMSIVAYTGTGSGPDTFPHSLGKTPFMVIVKRLAGGNGNWLVQHEAIGAQDLYMNTTVDVSGVEARFWNSTVFTDELVHIGTDSDCNLANTYIAYIFCETDFCKPINYTGNGNVDGPFANLGISPEWAMFKDSATLSAWTIYDSVRSPYNQIDDQLLANTTAAETTGSEEVDFVANGIKQRSPDAEINTSNSLFIGLAIGRPTQGGSNLISQSRAR